MNWIEVEKRRGVNGLEQKKIYRREFRTHLSLPKWLRGMSFRWFASDKRGFVKCVGEFKGGVMAGEKESGGVYLASGIKRLWGNDVSRIFVCFTANTIYLCPESFGIEYFKECLRSDGVYARE